MFSFQVLSLFSNDGFVVIVASRFYFDTWKTELYVPGKDLSGFCQSRVLGVGRGIRMSTSHF